MYYRNLKELPKRYQEQLGRLDLPISKRKNKYNAKKVKVDGYIFDSMKEARRYEELKLLRESGEVVFFCVKCPSIWGQG